jgi:CubicO group peptidase (beta-lactamase class C family)
MEPVKCALLVLLGGAVAFAQDAAVTTKLDDYVSRRIARGEFSGTIVVRQRGRELYRRNAGMANYELGVPIVGATRFRVASITKSFTAAAIVLLEEKKQLSFDDPLSKFLPEFPNGQNITVRHLLLHRSGIGDAGPVEDPSRVYTLREAIERFRTQPPHFAPGTSGRYSGAGYILLAHVVEKVSGRTYGEFLRANLLQPLGMTATGNFTAAEIVPARAAGYLPGPPPGNVSNAFADDLSPYLGEGSLYSTADDLLRWLEATRNETRVPLSRLEYPYGWGRRTYFERPALEQSGLHRGFAAIILTYPAEQLDIVCLMNVHTGFFNDCARGVTAFASEQFLPKSGQGIQLLKLTPLAGFHPISNLRVRSVAPDVRSTR